MVFRTHRLSGTSPGALRGFESVMLGQWPSSSSTVSPRAQSLGPLLFLIYILPLHHLILHHGLQEHGYADDIQVYLSISDPANPDTTWQEYTRLETCLTDIHLCMSANKLKLNTNKTAVLMVGTERRLSSFNLTAISVAGCRVPVYIFDRDHSLCKQVHRVVKSAYFHLCSIRLVRKTKAASSGPSNLKHGLLQQPSDRNSNKPHEPARNDPTLTCSSHL